MGDLPEEGLCSGKTVGSRYIPTAADMPTARRRIKARKGYFLFVFAVFLVFLVFLAFVTEVLLLFFAFFAISNLFFRNHTANSLMRQLCKDIPTYQYL
jgi:hypothetical protein